MTPKFKSSNVGNLNTPKESHKVLPVSEMVKVVDLKKEKKNHMLWLLKSAVYFYSFSILLSVIGNPILYLVYKLIFFMDIYIYIYI